MIIKTLCAQITQKSGNCSTNNVQGNSRKWFRRCRLSCLLFYIHTISIYPSAHIQLRRRLPTLFVNSPVLKYFWKNHRLEIYQIISSFAHLPIILIYHGGMNNLYRNIAVIDNYSESNKDLISTSINNSSGKKEYLKYID